MATDCFERFRIEFTKHFESLKRVVVESLSLERVLKAQLEKAWLIWPSAGNRAAGWTLEVSRIQRFCELMIFSWECSSGKKIRIIIPAGVMWGVRTVHFPCTLQAHTSLKCAIAKMRPLAKRRKACHSFVPKVEIHTILANIMHEPTAGMLIRHPLFLLLLGSKAEIVQLCPEHGKDTCFSQYAHWWWNWAWSGTFNVFNVLVEQGDLNVTGRFENSEFCLILTALEVQL